MIRRLGCFLLALLTVALIGTAVYSTIQARRAQKRFAQVRVLANKFLFDFHDSIKDVAGSLPARQLVASTAREYLDGLAAEASGDRELMIELGAAYEKTGDVLGDRYGANLGQTKEALASYRTALELLRQAAGDDPADRAKRFATWLRRFAPDAQFAIDNECLAEVLAPRGDRWNRKLARQLETNGAIPDAEAVYDAYFRVCCLTASVRELAVLAREALLNHEAAPAVLAQMAVGGLYEATGAWMSRVRCPAKSAVSGLFFAVVPERCVVAAGSPWLDGAGNPLVPMVAVA